MLFLLLSSLYVYCFELSHLLLSLFTLRWNTTDTEMKLLSMEEQEPKSSSLESQGSSEYSLVCFAHCQQF